MRKRRYEIYDPTLNVTILVTPSELRKHISGNGIHWAAHLDMQESVWAMGLRIKCVQ